MHSTPASPGISTSCPIPERAGNVDRLYNAMASLDYNDAHASADSVDDEAGQR
jgi:hypothetical protein